MERRLSLSKTALFVESQSAWFFPSTLPCPISINISTSENAILIWYMCATYRYRVQRAVKTVTTYPVESTRTIAILQLKPPFSNHHGSTPFQFESLTYYFEVNDTFIYKFHSSEFLSPS